MDFPWPSTGYNATHCSDEDLNHVSIVFGYDFRPWHRDAMGFHPILMLSSMDFCCNRLVGFSSLMGPFHTVLDGCNEGG